MEKILFNGAIEKYVSFIASLVSLKNDSENEEVKKKYQSFCERYDELRKNQKIKLAVWPITDHLGQEADLREIYYIDEPQLCAFIHIVLEEKAKKTFSKSFAEYSKDDFMEIKKELKSLWFIKDTESPQDFVYLEDEENMLDVQTKIAHLRIVNQNLKDKASVTEKMLNVVKYKSKKTFFWSRRKKAEVIKAAIEMEAREKRAYETAKIQEKHFDETVGSMIDGFAER